jgi:GDP-mannose 6-dehydrogenase
VIGVDVSRTKVDQVNSGKATIIEKDIDEIIKEQFESGRIRATGDFAEAVSNSDLTIICVGTPSSRTGHLNLDHIYDVATQIGEALRNKSAFHIIAIRSTVLPGTCDRVATIIKERSGKTCNQDFAVVSNPEFMREGSAVHDYRHPPFTLIGTDRVAAAETLAGLYSQIPAEIIITDLKTAEFMKYVSNAFHALKISFANEIGNICKELGIDSHKVMEIFCKDKNLNISPYYFKPGFAYGGSCLPKDLRALQTIAHDHYVKAPVIESIDNTNELQIKRAVDLIIGLNKKRIGFLGLSFKAGTDDLRNSPAVTVVEALIGKGCEVAIYDRNVQASRLTGTNKEYIDEHIPHLWSLIVGDIDELIGQCDVVVVVSFEPEFKDKLKRVVDKQIVDLIRIDEGLIGKGNYIGICW